MVVEEVFECLSVGLVVTEDSTFCVGVDESLYGRVGAIVEFGGTHTHGQCQEELLHLELVETVLGDEFGLYLQRIDFLDTLGQLRDAGDAFVVHGAQHFGHDAGEVEVYHQQVATEDLVGHIAELQCAAHTLNHQHTVEHFIRSIQTIDFVHRRIRETHARLFKLDVSRPSTIEQRNHTTKARIGTETYERSIHTPKSYVKIRTVVRLSLQVIDGYSIEELLHPFGRSQLLLTSTLLQHVANKHSHGSKIFAGKTFISTLSYNVDVFTFNNISSCAVVLLTLHHGHGQFLLVRSTVSLSCAHITIGQQAEECV